MSNVANATFGFTSWDEVSWDETESGLKLTRAAVANTFQGDIEGVSSLSYLMTYLPDGTAIFTGHERVTGRIGDREGSFVLKHEGTFSSGEASATITVIPGSATGGLAGLTGHGSYTASHVQPTPFTLEYAFE
jgi:hypothetical protein